ncbi:2TM domain-containing protein [Flagellimonas crocea]|uniref:2TM domain-containing protein n=1 Tax=Flagellimonas crocea TaxID=3067311 RepID=UPI00296E77EC|nr:2TM domain-containing protein [Muricauda sp. DH64]
MENFDKEKYKRAKKRVDEMKGFYIHLAIYLVINAFILVNLSFNTDNFWKWEHFITLFAWGLGILFHASKTFGFNPFLGKNWEERQIKKYMEEDKKEMNKYK